MTYWGLRDYGVSGQLGLEPTPEEYVQNLVAVFREIRRVLRDDGTLWLNLGDSYAGGGTIGRNDTTPEALARRAAKYGTGTGNGSLVGAQGIRPPAPGLKPKDLVGIPWRVAFALQADGWWLRSDIVWSKPNQMPERVTDRPTKAHEYLFLFSKGQWSRRTVELAHFPDVPLHLFDDGRANSTDVRCHQFCVALASTILQSPEAQERLGLSLLDSHERGEHANGVGRDAIGRLPAVERVLRDAARFRYGDLSAKRFLEELHGVGLGLTDSQRLVIAGGAAEFALAPPLYSNHQGTIAIQNSGEVCEYDLRCHALTIARPVGCSYYYDAEAIKEPHARLWDESNGGSWSYGKGDAQRVAERGKAGTHSGPYPLPSPTGRNKRTVWEIATQPFSGARLLGGGGGGNGRITSPDCPVHGDRGRAASKVPHDAPRAASDPVRNRRSEPRPAPVQQGGLFPTETRPVENFSLDNWDSPAPASEPTATPRSTETHRTAPAPETSPREIGGDESPADTERTAPQPERAATSDRTPESNTATDSASDGSGSGPWVYTEPRNDGKCSCTIIDHFATFPEALVEPCVLAGTSERGVCAACGAPWARVVERESFGKAESATKFTSDMQGGPLSRSRQAYRANGMEGPPPAKTLGWAPSCSCLETLTTQPLVLDPFAGSGTVGAVCHRLGRRFVGLELSAAYCRLAYRRTAQMGLV